MNYVPQLYDFLTRLSQNNNRPWFQANRAEFDQLRAAWLADLDRLIAAIASYWPEIASQSGKSAAYRIYRDTRFSLDKTPYKTYFSAAFNPWGKSAERAGFYIHMSPEDTKGGINDGIYGGLYMPSSPILKKMRQAIVDNIEEWEQIVNDPQLTALYPDWCADMLKRNPQGWPKDHPQGFYLRMKEYGKFMPLGIDFFSRDDWPELTAQLLRPMMPLIEFLNYTIDE